jgi:hypothetical protein
VWSLLKLSVERDVAALPGQSRADARRVSIMVALQRSARGEVDLKERMAVLLAQIARGVDRLVEARLTDSTTPLDHR